MLKIRTSEDITAAEIKRIAEAGKDPFIGAILLEYYKEFGESEAPKYPVMRLQDAMNPDSAINAEIKKNPVVVLDEPFQVYTIETGDILNYNSGVDLSSILKPTTKWFVPVFIHKKARAMLTVDYLDGEWKVVSIGMGDISEKVDKNKKMNVAAKDTNSKFVRIYPALSDFIVTDIQGNKKIFPFSYSVDALDLDSRRADSAGLYEVADVMPHVIDVVRKNITQ